MRIIYLNFFSRHEVSGGIKMAYRSVEALRDAGCEAAIWQPDGRADWFSSRATVIIDPRLRLKPDDILVFPETLREPFLSLLGTHPHIPKILFCQNPYNLLASDLVPGQTPRSLGFSQTLCVSHISAGMLGRVFDDEHIGVVPVAIDGALFRPQAKAARIAYSPRKLRGHAGLVRKVFAAKCSDMAHVEWRAIEAMSESEAAGIMGRSQVFLALGHFESCPLLPLEAMSSGCAVVGYHGYGGLEYATPRNGFWHYQDEIEEVADNLHRVLAGLACNDSAMRRMVEEGQATAARFNALSMQKALVDFFANVKAPLAA